MTFRRISILGLGLLGSSVGLAIKSKINDCEITGYDENPSTMEAAKQRAAIDQTATSAAQSVQTAELVVLATPIGSFEPLMVQIAAALPESAVVCDVGSTKRTIVRLAGRLLKRPSRFVGCHPMAGSEKQGVAAARVDLLDGSLCILTPDEQTDPACVSAVEQFWKSLNMRTVRLTPERHDELVASISHLPHALAAALVSIQPNDALPLAGRGFLDSTRIAAGDAGLWKDILLDNSDHLQNALAAHRRELDRLEMILEKKDAVALERWLARAAIRRRGMP